MTKRPPKYVVFKAEEYEEYRERGEEPPMLDDAEVIRHQDVFAAPALLTYANSVAVSIETLSPFWGKLVQYGTETDEGTALAHQVAETMSILKEIADHFFEAAAAAEQAERKLPD